jgi:hypothetical protein
MIFNKRRFRVPACVERDEAYTIKKICILTKVPVYIFERREEDDELQGREKSKCKAKEIQLAEERLLS